MIKPDEIDALRRLAYRVDRPNLSTIVWTYEAEAFGIHPRRWFTLIQKWSSARLGFGIPLTGWHMAIHPEERRRLIDFLDAGGRHPGNRAKPKRASLVELQGRAVRIVRGACRGYAGRLQSTVDGWFVEVTSEGPWIAVGSSRDVEPVR